jgi:fatty acid desaturase
MIRHEIPSRTNAGIVVVQLALILACLRAAALADSAAAIALVAALFGILMNSVYSSIHEAEHGMLFRHRRLNDAAGVLMALFFPAPFHLIRQGHIGHHLRNRSDDEAFDFYFDGEPPLWKKLQLYGILTGFYWLAVVFSNLVVLALPFLLKRRLFEFDRPSAAFMESLNPRYLRLIQLEAGAVILLHSALILGFQLPPSRYAAVYLGFGWSWSALQYVHHFGTERHVTRGARNLWIGQPLDLLWLNHNWHRAHHEHPTVPWPYLPGIGRREADAAASQERGQHEREFLLRAYLRMWRGPRYTKERVENRFAGRVVA